MGEESIITIQEELSKDFLSLAGAHPSAIRRLIERLDDVQLGIQLQFEWFKREQRWQEPERMTVAINIRDEEQSVDPQLQPDQPPKEAGGEH